MIRKALALIIASLAFVPMVSHATISFLVQADLLKDQNGAPIPQNALVLLVASTGDGAFQPIIEGGSTQAGSPLTPGGDDYIVYRTGVNTTGEPGVYDIATGGLNLATIPGWNPGDPLALLWFPTLTNSSSLITAGTRYGLYTKAIAVPGEESAWITPADPTSNYRLAFYTQDGGTFSPGPTASNPAVAGRSSGAVAPVPEPGAVGLLALGLAGLAAQRRRK